MRLAAFRVRLGRFARFCTIPGGGGQVSEVLALTPKQIEFNAQTIIFETLKKRKIKRVGLDRFCYYLDNVIGHLRLHLSSPVVS